MGILIDTNVFLRSWIEHDQPLPAGHLVTSSVVLQELFLAQRGQEAFAYALPFVHPPIAGQSVGPASFHTDHAKARPVANSADKIILDFAGELPSRSERGHATLASAYNSANRSMIQAYTSVLGKEQSRSVLRKYDALKRLQVQAIPLRTATAQLGLELFSEFGNSHNVKKNTRNTMNDMLILAEALGRDLTLASHDQELVTFAHEVAGREMTEKDEVYYSVPTAAKPFSTVRRESTCFINNPWRAKRAGF